ncbi:MAG: dihydropteroate synthase, partial [Coriobacteriia bacterium]|nr:dihydropteroate synthase [Coriobacteriia bacterium]
RTGFGGTVLAGPRGIATIGPGNPVAVIGERINPTGKPVLADSLRAGSMSVVREFAAAQAEAGADLLDVNVGAAGVDQVAMMREAVLALVGSTDLPLVLDTTDPQALEAALRAYPGRALINSVNGGAESLEAVLPLAGTYGAAVVVLALDDEGIPETIEGRVAIVERVRKAAHRTGLADVDLVVDTLVMTAAAEPDAPRITTGALAAVRASGLSTILGVSNVSHGLPGRPELNAAFIGVATAAGLDAAIVSPSDHVVTEAIRVANATREAGVDPEAHGSAWDAWDAAYRTALEIAQGGGEGSDAAAGEGGQHGVAPTAAERLSSAISRGDAQGAPALVDAVIEGGMAPGEVIGGVLTPAIQRLGDAFGRGEAFLPQLMVAAEAMKAAVARVRTYLPADATGSEGRVVFATVKGDIHSIGKDICVSLLESQGFDVTDLGVDVEPEAVAGAVRASSADAVCLSALMTTTLPAMERTVALLAEETPALPVLVGGAVVTGEWAASIGAGYSADAPGCVREVRAAVQKAKKGLES